MGTLRVNHKNRPQGEMIQCGQYPACPNRGQIEIDGDEDVTIDLPQETVSLEEDEDEDEDEDLADPVSIDPPGEATRETLMERARELEIPGRSTMDKEQLAAAIAEMEGSN